MDVNWGSPATLSRRKTLSCCSANWIGTCRRNLHPGSRKRVNCLRSKSWCRPFGVEGVCSGTYAFLPAPVTKVGLSRRVVGCFKLDLNRATPKSLLLELLLLG